MTCQGKATYRTFTEATQKAKRSHMRHGGAMMAYHCQMCGRYHFGNRPVRPPRKEQRVNREEYANVD